MTPPPEPRASLWTPAWIGLGSNLDDPPRQLDAALAGLAALPRTRLVASSRRYWSDPVGPQDQPRFLNAAAALVTQLGAEPLHAALRTLETALGKRPPAVRFGPRRIDLDLLAYDALTFKSDTLELPHPRLHERAFVLYPLAELAPELWIAGRGRVAALKAAVAGDTLSPL
ncbi:MAG TPA: 2-amino-4-hydroxy-6-hydroxymethyldihydropteridine diphosphokinase [Steroidobacteraceae bacterium]|nr:2-amino-4-hydroxy-6-hydroxymethyldihydropteridine diphosphokinase [Steroidobacteraceae bacterium]